MSAEAGKAGDDSKSIVFSSFRLDRRSGRLTRAGLPIPLRAETWAVLLYLAERPGVLVTREELLDAVWPGVVTGAGDQNFSVIGLPELDLGTVPAWGESARLLRCVGRDHAIDMILRAKTISGPEALRIGLVTEVWPNAELKARAVALGEELASMPRLAVKAMLRCLVGSEMKTLAESLRDERDAVHATLGTPDQIEGIKAFLEKRKPVFHRG